jgi:hypothetical protein
LVLLAERKANAKSRQSNKPRCKRDAERKSEMVKRETKYKWKHREFRFAEKEALRKLNDNLFNVTDAILTNHIFGLQGIIEDSRTYEGINRSSSIYDGRVLQPAP